MKKTTVGYKYFIPPFFIFLSICSCRNNTESINPKERSLVMDSVGLMMSSIAKDLSHEGPVAWLSYFENAPDFFMASNGQLVFPNIDTARYFIKKTLVTIMPKIELRWSNIRVDPLTNKLAGISASFHEDITNAAGNTTPQDGYFTAIVHQTSQGWKLHNAHWSGIVNH